MAAALTKKQEAFAIAYIKTGNATEAYRQAYDAAKMSDAALNVEACRALRNPKVALRIEELRAPALEAAQVDVERWMRETSKYAFADPSDELKHADKRGYLDMMARSLGAYEKDNAQQRESLVLKIEAARPAKR